MSSEATEKGADTLEDPKAELKEAKRRAKGEAAAAAKALKEEKKAIQEAEKAEKLAAKAALKSNKKQKNTKDDLEAPLTKDEEKKKKKHDLKNKKKDEDEDPEDEDEDDASAMAEELEEEEQDVAVRFLQRAFRNQRARRLVRELVISNFVKEYDQEAQVFYYRNKRTGAKQIKKPLALGDSDLPEPVTYFAPKGYEAEPSRLRQFALVVHCCRFIDKERLPLLPKQVTTDHYNLRKSLVHPFLAKFNEDDCMFIKDTTSAAALTSLDMFVDLVNEAPDKAAVLFVYIATHAVNLTRGTHKGAYFCFTDTNVRSGDSLRRTAVSARHLCKRLAEINCSQKTVVLDCCHSVRPKDTAFKTVVLYPPPDLYSSVAEMAMGCRVVGSCKLGPHIFSKKQEEEQLFKEVVVEKEQLKKRHRSRILLPRLLPRLSVVETESGYLVLDEIDEIRAAPGLARSYLRSSLHSALTNNRKKRRGAQRAADIETKKAVLATYERAVYNNEESSCFGAAVTKALQGAASSMTRRSPHADFFEDREQQRISTEGFIDYVRRETAGQSVQAAGDGDETVGAAPSPPPAPLPPYALSVRDRSALLEWSMPPFSGATTMEYALQSMGTAKFDSKEWAPVADYYDDVGKKMITATRCQAPHLVPGMPIRFRVRARNAGGWGPWSLPSAHIRPLTTPVESIAEEMRRHAQEGVPHVIAAMRRHKTVSEAQRLGTRQIATSAQKQKGFRRPQMAKDAALVVIDAMAAYALDVDLQAKGCLVLGWCFYKNKKLARTKVQQQAEFVICQAKLNHAADVAVHSNATWALFNLQHEGHENMPLMSTG